MHLDWFDVFLKRDAVFGGVLIVNRNKLNILSPCASSQVGTHG